MSTIDRIMVIATLAAAVWWAVARRRRPRALAALSAGALVAAVGALAFEGVVWQLVPWQLLAAAVAGAAALRHWRPGHTRRCLRVIGRSALVVGLALGGITLLTAFVPTIPKPSGPHHVGSEIFRWTDGRRAETLTADPSDRRQVIAQAWYPTDIAEGPAVPYFEAQGRLPGSISGLPSFMFTSFGSIRTHAIGGGLGGLAGLAAFAIFERRTASPLLRIERLADRAVGGGLFLMLAAAGSIFGLFLLSSLYLQNVLGMGPLATGLAFVPLAVAAGIGAHNATGHIVSRFGVRGPLTGAFIVAAGGMTLLAHVSGTGSYVGSVLPGMLVAGLGLGVAVVSVSIAILTGARSEEAGMISGPNSTGHEIGGTIGIAVFSTIAAGTASSPGPTPPGGSPTRSSQPRSSRPSPAWSRWPSCPRHATSSRSHD